MMPDLGKYAFAIYSAYGISLTLLGALVLQSWIRSKAVKARLEAAEARAKNGQK